MLCLTQVHTYIHRYSKKLGNLKDRLVHHKGQLLAALIGYRVIYFLIPLMLAVVVYLVLEKRAKAMRSKNEARSEH